MSVRDTRLTVNLGAIVSLAEAVRLLPVRDQLARDWLTEQGLVAHIGGRPVVSWAAVHDALRTSPPVEDVPPRPVSTALPRVCLD